jgi:hypothetical protein
LTAGNGRDSVFAHEGTYSIHLGRGNDTVLATGGLTSTVTTGNGNDRIVVIDGGHSLIRAGNGNDTIIMDQDSGDIHVGHGHDAVQLHFGSYTVVGDPGGHDTITADHGVWRIDAQGRDVINLNDGSGAITIGSGHDTINAADFSGTVSGHGHDSIKVTNASADVSAGGGHDTISVGGAINLAAGHNDLIAFQDLSTIPAGTHLHLVKSVLATVSGGHDTFVYQFDDDNHESGLHVGDADSKGIGADAIVGFAKKTDVLRFHDTGGDPFTQADLQNAATLIDHVGGHSITIVIHTSAGSAAGTIVLKGLGTIHHQLTSINDLVNHGYHLQFS